jgi:hypothetical protein
MLWHSLALGIDYVLWVSTAPAYFSDVLNHSGQYGSTSNDTADLLEDAVAGFSTASSLWAAGQMLGCLTSAPLPRMLGYRWAFTLLVFLAFMGSIMYSVGGIVGGEAGKYIAWFGKALNGYGDGSVALTLAYIPIVLFKEKKKMDAALINTRMLMAFGTFVGGAMSLGLEEFAITEDMVDGVTRVFSGGDFVGWAMAILYVPSIMMGCCALDHMKPPVAKGKDGKEGSACTPYCSRKSCFWLFLVFSYGLTGSIATFFLPVFPYCPGYCNSLASLAPVTLSEFVIIIFLFFIFVVAAIDDIKRSCCCSCKLCVGSHCMRTSFFYFPH